MDPKTLLPELAATPWASIRFQGLVEEDGVVYLREIGSVQAANLTS